MIFLIFFFFFLSLVFLVLTTFFLTVRLGPPLYSDRCRVSSDSSFDAAKESSGSSSALASPSCWPAPAPAPFPFVQSTRAQNSTHSFWRPAVILYTYFISFNMKWHNKKLYLAYSFLCWSSHYLPCHSTSRSPGRPSGPKCIAGLLRNRLLRRGWTS